MKKYNTILSIFIFYILLNMILFPKVYIDQTLNGITAWAFNVLPSILPFIIFSKILSSLGTIDKISKVFSKPCKFLFNTPAISSYVFFTSIISGYPVGAKLTSDLFIEGKITKDEAFRMTSFCSTSGPMFIIGAVGIGMLSNALYGYIIFISHILGAILNGIIFKRFKTKNNCNHIKNIKSHSNNSANTINKDFNLSNIIVDSSLSIISVGVIIAIFFVIITSLNPIFNLFPSNIASILEGLIEITKGCIDISTSMSGIISVIAITFIISFGGLSTILQSITMLNKLQMPIWLFTLQKLSHAILSTIIALLLSLLFL